jgi:2'-5' RNA ligase
MTRIAVDVALLPDEVMTERAIRINRELIAEYAAKIILSKNNRLPHISLAMGAVDESDVESIGDTLDRFAREIPVGQLNALGIAIVTNTKGEPLSILTIERTESLRTLHEAIMREILPLLSSEVTESMISDERVADTTLEWIRDYPRKAAFDRFSPHITLGYGRAPAEGPFPIPFTVSRLALCHLGNHCTCRQPLVSVAISGQ